MTETTDVGLRARKKERTRRALRVAALARARSQGPDGFTLDEVCADADVSARTFFNYFPTKDAALFDWDDESVAQLESAVRDRGEAEPLAAVVAVVSDLAEALTTSPIWHEQLELLRAHPELLGRMAQVERTVEQALARGLTDRADVDERGARTAAALAMAALHVTVTDWLADPSGPDIRAVYRDVLGRARTAFAGTPVQ